MKTISKISIEETGIAAAFFFMLWTLARSIKKSSARSIRGIFCENYYIRLPLLGWLHYGKHSRMKMATLTLTSTQP